jgi:Zn-dependent M28 family amino/carboxypeptidase
MNQTELSAIASRARRVIEILASEYPSRHGQFPSVLNGAADFIEQEFQDLGYIVESQPYVSEGTKVRNLVVEKKGSKPELSCIVLGAHYDTVVGTPGADDNATGVAGLLELARLLKNQAGRHTIRFVAFPNEEPPYFYTHLMGSRQYAKALKDKRENVLVMLALEMLGYAGENYPQLYPAPFMRVLEWYPKYGNFIGLVGNLHSLRMMSVVRSAMRTQKTVGVESLSAPGFIPPLFLSDHSSFWKAGFPALMVTDSAFLRNPHYHGESDTPDTLNYDFLARVVEAVFAAVKALDATMK